MDNLKLSHPALAIFGTLFLAAVAFISGVSAVSLLNSHSNGVQVASVAAVTPDALPQHIALDPASIAGKAAVIYDPATGNVLFSKNADVSLPLASLTKLMTATVVLDHETPDTTVTIDAGALAPDGDWGFQVGDVVPLSSLLKIGLIASSNDAMQAAAESIGTNYLTYMNQEARDRGYTSMRFLNPTGLDESTTTAGAYGSAYDITRLASAFFKAHPEYFGLTTHEAKVVIQDGTRTLSAEATALPIEKLPGLVAAKTGYTDLAGGNLVVVFDVSVGHPLVAAVLGSTEQGRFDDMETLIRAVRESH